MSQANCDDRTRVHTQPNGKCRPALWLCFLLLVVVTATPGEEIRGCSSVNSRAVSLDDGWVLMRDDGKILTSRKYCNGGEYSDGVIQFELCGKGPIKEFHYLAPDGIVVFTILASDAGRFSMGLVAVQNGNGRWGYVDHRGDQVIAPRFNEAGPFSEGLAAIEIDDNWSYINLEGDVAIHPTSPGKIVNRAYAFNSGAALVLLSDSNGKAFKGLIDHSGNWEIEPTRSLTGGLINGLAPFWPEDGNKEGFVNAAGGIVIPARFTGSAQLPFQDGLAAVRVDGPKSVRTGFIGSSGAWVVEPRFEDALHFCNGLAPVKVGAAWGFIDPAGHVVIRPRFIMAESFDGGIAKVYEKDRGGTVHEELINAAGKLLYRSSGKTEIIGPSGN